MKTKPKLAYIIPGPNEALTLEVLYSANAWWMDPSKLHRLLKAFDNYQTIREACVYAGITLKQYKYFAKLHPLMHERREAAHTALSLAAKLHFAGQIKDGDMKAVMSYLKQIHPEEFGTPRRKRKVVGTPIVFLN